MTKWIRMLAAWKWALSTIVVASTSASILLAVWSRYQSDWVKSVLIGIATGLFAGVAVTVIVAVVEGRREDLVRLQTRRLWLELATTLDFQDLEGEDLAGINLSGKSLRLANLKGTILVGAALTSCNLKGADLSHADLTDAEVELTDFEDADLRSTKFIRTDARGANFDGALMNWETEFTGAHLSTMWADLDGSLPGTRSDDINYLVLTRNLFRPKNTSFRGAKFYSSGDEIQETGMLCADTATYDRNTDWPEFQRVEPGGAVEAPKGAILDDRTPDLLEEIERRSEEADPTIIDEFNAEMARWEYKAEPLYLPQRQALLREATEMAASGWELTGVVELKHDDLWPGLHLLYKRAKASDFTWIEAFLSGSWNRR